MIALGIGEGDEVITTPFTVAATANVIMRVGEKPVFVDIKRNTSSVDPERMKDAITPRTKAIMPVHYAGRLCEMGAIMEIAREQNLYVIENAPMRSGRNTKAEE